MPDANRIIANQLESAANTVSGLALGDIGEDGHALANRLWKVAAHLKNRSRRNVAPSVIRAWARLNGYYISDVARIPSYITNAYYHEVVDPPADDL
jgi:hypothetical protein